MSDFCFEISIPADNDGFVPMQCPLCGEFFKLRPEDAEDDAVFEIRCPLCGISSDGYFTQDVIDLAFAKVKNVALDRLHGEMKELERRSKNDLIRIEAGKAHTHEYEPRIMQGFDALTRVVCENCGRPAKVASALKMSAYNCPCCGVSNFNDR